MRRTRRGVALVAVLWTVALLATVTAIASRAARTSAAVAANTRAQAIARAMAESGIVAGVSVIDDSLRAFRGNATRRDQFLNQLDVSVSRERNGPFLQDSVQEGVFALTIVDVTARLDVNNAGADGLATLFATLTSPGVARDMGARIDAAVRGDLSGRADASSQDLAYAREANASEANAREANAQRDEESVRAARDSLKASLLGREAPSPQRRPFESLDDVRALAGIDMRVMDAAAPMLTVDGDGRVNRRAAPAAVRLAASGSLVDAPTRILLIARGWQRGHPLTREIQAVYDVDDAGLRLVRWRELDR